MSLFSGEKNKKQTKKIIKRNVIEKWQLNNRRVIRQKIDMTISILDYSLLIDCSFGYKSVLP